MRPRGRPAWGNNFVRYAYLDESGRGSPDREPYLVVAGVIVNADRQLQPIERRLAKLVEKYVPEGKRDGFYFHAKELANGGGKVFDRKTYPENRRLKALEDICRIPARFKLPIIFHGIDRKKAIADHPDDSIADVTTLCQASCSTACLLEIERYMRERARKREVATLVYENTDEARRHIREVHNFMKRKPIEAIAGSDSEIWARFTPLQRIAETAFFAEKIESSLLQVADAIAFVLNRQFRQIPGTERFISKFRRNIVALDE